MLFHPKPAPEMISEGLKSKPFSNLKTLRENGPRTQPTQQTTQCSTVETWEPCLVAERLRVHAEMSTLHKTWKQRSYWFQRRTSINPNCNEYPIFHKRDATPCFYFSFVGMADDWSRPAIRATVRFLQRVIVSSPPLPPSPHPSTHSYFSACINCYYSTPQNVTHMHARCFGLRAEDQSTVKSKK